MHSYADQEGLPEAHTNICSDSDRIKHAGLSPSISYCANRAVKICVRREKLIIIEKYHLVTYAKILCWFYDKIYKEEWLEKNTKQPISSKSDVITRIRLLVQEHLRLPQDFKIRTNEVTI